jgi:hypothetical protein
MNSLFRFIEKKTIDETTCRMGTSKSIRIPILITVAAGICSSLTSGCIVKPEIWISTIKPITTSAKEMAVPTRKTRLTQFFNRFSSI